MGREGASYPTQHVRNCVKVGYAAGDLASHWSLISVVRDLLLVSSSYLTKVSKIPVM